MSLGYFFSAGQFLPPASALLAGATSRFGSSLDGGYAGEGPGGGAMRPSPGKMTLTSRLSGRSPSPGGGGAPTEGPDAYLPSAGPLDDPFGLHLISGGETGAASAAPAQQLAFSPRVDFGEVPVGETQRENAFVYNLHSSGRAFVSASLEGNRDLSLGYPVPQSLRPSREEAGNPLSVVYQPQNSGVAQATLIVRAAWEAYTGWSPEEVKIPVEGTAYRFGEEKPSVVAAERADEGMKAEEKAADAARDRELDAKVADDDKIADPYHQGIENRLNDAFLRAADALEILTDKQGIGIRVAENEAGMFQRKLNPAEMGLMTLLAMQALDMATYGLAGMASSWARSVMTKKITVPPQWTLRRGVPVPPKPGALPTETTNLPLSLAITVSESLKKGLRDAGKSARDAILKGGSSDRAANDDISQEDRVNFFSRQYDALADSKKERQDAVRNAMIRLRPLMRTKKPDSAPEAMNAIADGLEEAAKAALKTQADEARFAWMRFLAEREIGSAKTAKEGESAIDLNGALDLPNEYDGFPMYDGLLDLEISADYFHPERELKILRARMNGVIPSMTQSLPKMTLSEILKKGVPVRVHFKIPELAAMPVVIALDRDRIAYADETSAAGQTSHWLSLAGGYIGRPSPERQRQGALALKERLMSRKLADEGLQVETDHEG